MFIDFSIGTNNFSPETFARRRDESEDSDKKDNKRQKEKLYKVIDIFFYTVGYNTFFKLDRIVTQR